MDNLYGSDDKVYDGYTPNADTSNYTPLPDDFVGDHPAYDAPGGCVLPTEPEPTSSEPTSSEPTSSEPESLDNKDACGCTIEVADFGDGSIELADFGDGSIELAY